MQPPHGLLEGVHAREQRGPQAPDALAERTLDGVTIGGVAVMAGHRSTVCSRRLDGEPTIRTTGGRFDPDRLGEP